MRGFREIRVREVNRKEDKVAEEGYKKIKPETDITFEEAQNFWDNIFNNMSEEES